MKKLLSVIICTAIIIAAFSGCEGREIGERAPLKILVDYGANGIQLDNKEYSMKMFLEQVAEMGGPADVEAEFLPGDGEERELALQNLRAEVMAGHGPDLFIMRSNASRFEEDKLFPIPEKAMMNRMFYPLGKYIEKAKITDWSKLTPKIMEAGQYNGEQYIVPVGYAFNSVIFKRDDVQPMDPVPWREAAASDDLILRKCAASAGSGSVYVSSIGDIMGKIADYEKETVTLSEDELCEIFMTAMDLFTEDMTIVDKDSAAPATDTFATLPDCLSTPFTMDYTNIVFEPMMDYAAVEHFSGKNDDLTVLPLSNLAGGVTASVTSYAAVNGGSKRAEDAFFIIDVLMSPEFQSRSGYGTTVADWLLNSLGLSVNSEMGQEDHTLGSSRWYLSDENFKELCRVRDMITDVKISGRLDRLISVAYSDCCDEAIQLYFGKTTREEYEKAVKDRVAELYYELKVTLSEA